MKESYASFRSFWAQVPLILFGGWRKILHNKSQMYQCPKILRFVLGSIGVLVDDAQDLRGFSPSEFTVNGQNIFPCKWPLILFPLNPLIEAINSDATPPGNCNSLQPSHCNSQEPFIFPHSLYPDLEDDALRQEDALRRAREESRFVAQCFNEGVQMQNASKMKKHNRRPAPECHVQFGDASREAPKSKIQPKTDAKAKSKPNTGKTWERQGHPQAPQNAPLNNASQAPQAPRNAPQAPQNTPLNASQAPQNNSPQNNAPRKGRLTRI